LPFTESFIGIPPVEEYSTGSPGTLAEVRVTLAEVCVTLAEIYVTLAEVYVTLAEICVTLAEVYVTLAEIYVTLAEVYVTLAEIYVTLAEVHVTLAEVCVTLAEVYVTLAEVYVTLVEVRVTLPEVDVLGAEHLADLPRARQVRPLLQSCVKVVERTVEVFWSGDFPDGLGVGFPGVSNFAEVKQRQSHVATNQSGAGFADQRGAAARH